MSSSFPGVSISTQVAASEKLNGAKDPSAVLDLAQTQIGNRFKLLHELRWRHFCSFDFLNVNGVLPFAMAVTWPKVELVPGPDRGAMIDQGRVRDRSLRFRQVKGDFADQAVVTADNEHVLILGQELLHARLVDGPGWLRPGAHAAQRIPIGGQCIAGELGYKIGVMQQNRRGKT